MTRNALSLALALLAAAAPARADVVDVVADRDNTLYLNGSGSLSNGAGEAIFSGLTAMGASRRAVLHFDLSGIPAGATINGVTLTLDMTMTISGDQSVSLHRALADWGEGTSDPVGQEGGGAASTPRDATWRHRFWPDCQWSALGGDFAPAASATSAVGVAFGPYTWTSAALAADVQAWIDGALPNYGWLLKHDVETGAATAKRFASKDNANPSIRPRLTIDFTPASGSGATNYCGPAVVNSSGCPAQVFWTGSLSVGAGNFTVTAEGLPAGQFGYFIASRTQGFFMPGTSVGFVCVGGNIGRFNAPGQIIVGPSGSLTPSLASFPVNPPVPVAPGDTWNFQCWYRDAGLTSNFTDGLQVTFD